MTGYLPNYFPSKALILSEFYFNLKYSLLQHSHSNQLTYEKGKKITQNTTAT